MNPNPSEPSANPINPPADPSASSRKFRSDAKLLNLPADQRDELVEWLLDGMSYKEAQQNVASTFGIEIRSLNRFSEFWDAFCVPRILERREQCLTNTRIHAAAAIEAAPCFDLATFDAIRHRAYLLASAPASSIDDITRALDLILRIRKLEYAERKLALAQSRQSTPQPRPEAAPADNCPSRPAGSPQPPAASSAAASAALKDAWARLNRSNAKNPSAVTRHIGIEPDAFSATPPRPSYLTPSL